MIHKCYLIKEIHSSTCKYGQNFAVAYVNYGDMCDALKDELFKKPAYSQGVYDDEDELIDGTERIIYENGKVFLDLNKLEHGTIIDTGDVTYIIEIF